VQTDRSWGEDGTGHGEKGTTHPTDMVKGMDMATSIDAFGINSLHFTLSLSHYISLPDLLTCLLITCQLLKCLLLTCLLLTCLPTYLPTCLSTCLPTCPQCCTIRDRADPNTRIIRVLSAHRPIRGQYGTPTLGGSRNLAVIPFF
jgi:hypothetical protein